MSVTQPSTTAPLQSRNAGLIRSGYGPQMVQDYLNLFMPAGIHPMPTLNIATTLGAMQHGFQKPGPAWPSDTEVLVSCQPHQPSGYVGYISALNRTLWGQMISVPITHYSGGGHGPYGGHGAMGGSYGGYSGGVRPSSGGFGTQGGHGPYGGSISNGIQHTAQVRYERLPFSGPSFIAAHQQISRHISANQQSTSSFETANRQPGTLWTRSNTPQDNRHLFMIMGDENSAANEQSWIQTVYPQCHELARHFVSLFGVPNDERHLSFIDGTAYIALPANITQPGRTQAQMQADVDGYLRDNSHLTPLGSFNRSITDLLDRYTEPIRDSNNQITGRRRRQQFQNTDTVEIAVVLAGHGYGRTVPGFGLNGGQASHISGGIRISRGQNRIQITGVAGRTFNHTTQYLEEAHLRQALQNLHAEFSRAGISLRTLVIVDTCSAGSFASR